MAFHPMGPYLDEMFEIMCWVRCDMSRIESWLELWEREWAATTTDLPPTP